MALCTQTKLQESAILHFSVPLVLRPESIWQVIALTRLIGMFFHKRLWHSLTPCDRTLYTRSFVTDGNFSADHLKQKRPEDDVWLLRGEGMITGKARYEQHLKVAIERYTVSIHLHARRMHLG